MNVEVFSINHFAGPPVLCDGVCQWWWSHVQNPAGREIQRACRCVSLRWFFNISVLLLCFHIIIYWFDVVWAWFILKMVLFCLYRFYAAEIAIGLFYLHSQGTIYRFAITLIQITIFKRNSTEVYYVMLQIQSLWFW
jgi:hypothetical protein